MLAAIGGSHFYKIAGWVGGPNYEPLLSCMIKCEPKKFRKLVNADMVAFTKQSFVYDWIDCALKANSKEKFHYFLPPKKRLVKSRRISTMCSGEKWACPLDLRDFHI